MKQISVIIPCYNVEEYIDRCLDTLVNQTIGLDALEIILVNDASTDHTLEKLKEWEQRYQDHIKVITYTENIRQGGARNKGMKCASGEYIGFVDSDDWIELDMYETLYREAVRGDFDMVQGKYIQSKEKTDEDHKTDQYHCIEYRFESVKDLSYRFSVNDYGCIGEIGGVWSAIYKRSIIVENEVWFPEKIVYEDNYWSSVLHLYLKNLCVVDKIIYHYFVNAASTVRSMNTAHHMDRLEIEIGILEEYKQRGVFDLFYDDLCREFIQRFYLNSINLFFVRYQTLPDIFGWMEDVTLENFPDYENIIDITSQEDYSEFERLFLEMLGNWKLCTKEQIYKIRDNYVHWLMNCIKEQKKDTDR